MNINAGHLVITLLENTNSSLAAFILGVLVSTQILRLVLESAVAIIKSYVFAVKKTSTLVK